MGNSYLWKILFIHWLVWGFIAMDRLLPIYFAPMIMQDFQINQYQFGLLMSGLTITWAIMAVVGGHLADRFGRAKVVFPSIIWFSATTLFSGFAQTFGQLFGLRALIGIGEGAYWGSGVAHVSEVWPEKKRGFALGFHQTGFPIIGTFIGGSIMAYVGMMWGWRSAFLVAGIAGIILSIIFKMTVRESKVFLESKGRQGAVENQHKIQWSDMSQIYKNRNLLVNLAIVAFAMIGYWSVSTFMGVYLTETKGFNLAVAGGIIGITGISGLLGQWFTAWYSDHIGRRAAYVIATLCGTVGTLIIIAANSTAVLIIGLIITGYGIYGPLALGLAVIPGDVVDKRFVGTAAGVTMLVSELFGMTGPILGGRFNDMYGQTGSLWLGTAAFVIATLLVAALRETAPKFAARTQISGDHTRAV